MVDDNEKELLVGGHHDLVLLQLEPDEGQIVVGVLLEEDLSGAADDLVQHAGEGLRALGVHVRLDGGTVAVEDEHAPYRLGRGQLAEALFQFCRHPEQPNRRGLVQWFSSVTLPAYADIAFSLFSAIYFHLGSNINSSPPIHQLTKFIVENL